MSNALLYWEVLILLITEKLTQSEQLEYQTKNTGFYICNKLWKNCPLSMMIAAKKIKKITLFAQHCYQEPLLLTF